MGKRELVAELIVRLRDQLTGPLGKTNGALDAHARKLKDLNAKAKALDGYAKLRGQLQQTRTSLDQSRRKVGELKAAIEKADGANLDRLRADLTQAETKVKKTADVFATQLGRMRGEIGKLNAKGIRVGDADGILRDRDRARENLERRTRATNRAEGVGRAGRRVGDAGRTGTATGVVAGYGAARAIGSEYNFQLMSNRTRAKLSGQREFTVDEFEPLRQMAIDTAQTRPWTATNVMGGAFELASAGLTPAQVMGAMPGTVDLASAGDLAISEAADIATNVMTAMRLPMETTDQVAASLARVNDVLNYTAANSNTNVRQLGEAFKYSAPFAGQLGIEIEQLAGWFGVMATNGIRGNEAGVAMRSAIVRLIKPTKGARSALATLGMDFEDYYSRSTPLTGSSVAASLRTGGTGYAGMEADIEAALAGGETGGALIEQIAETIENGLGDGSVLGKAEIRRQVSAALLSGIEKMDLQGFFEDLFAATGGNPTAYMPHIFDQRQGGRINSLMVGRDPNDPTAGIAPGAFMERLTTDAPGSTERAAGIIMSDMVGDLKRLESAIDALVRAIFDSGVDDAVANIAEALTELVNALAETNPRIIEFGTYAAALGLALMPLMWIGGRLLSFAAALRKATIALGLVSAADAATDAIGGGKTSRKAGTRGRIPPAVAGLGRLGAYGAAAAATIVVLKTSVEQAEQIPDVDENPRGYLATVRKPRDEVEAALLDEFAGRIVDGMARIKAEQGYKDLIHAYRTNADTTARLAELFQQRHGREPGPVADSAAASVEEMAASIVGRLDSAVDRLTAISPSAGVLGGAGAANDNAFAQVTQAVNAEATRVRTVTVNGAVATQPSGTQDVRVTNPTPVVAPVNVTVNVKTQADPAAIGAATGAATQRAIRNAYQDGGP